MKSSNIFLSRGPSSDQYFCSLEDLENDRKRRRKTSARFYLNPSHSATNIGTSSIACKFDIQGRLEVVLIVKRETKASYVAFKTSALFLSPSFINNHVAASDPNTAKSSSLSTQPAHPLHV